MDDESPDRASRSIGSLTSATLSSLSVKGGTTDGLPVRGRDAAITIGARATSLPISTRHGELGSAIPTSLSAAIASSNPASVDRALAALLPRSVASACQAKWTDTVGEFGWDGEIQRYELVTMPPSNDLAAASSMILAATHPAPASVVKAELARLRATTISRNADAGDLALTFAAYADALSEYPADVVIDTCRYWSRNEKWWPALSELRTRMDHKFRRRKLLAAAIADARSAVHPDEPAQFDE